MREFRGVEVARMVDVSVAKCQSDLTACYDLLVECSPSTVARLELELFDAHRALGALRLVAGRVSGRNEACALLRSPGKG